MLLDIVTHKDNRGYLSFLESHNPIPFKIGEIHLYSNVSEQALSQIVLNKDLDIIIIALVGVCNISIITTDKHNEIYTLDQPSIGVYIPAGKEYQFNNTSPYLSLLIISSK